MDRKTIKKPLNQFIQKVIKSGNPDSIILYGSFARGEATSWSDIDLAVIGKTKISKLEKIADSINSKFYLDIRSYSKNQFDNINPLSIYSEIKREGIMIYSQDAKS